MLMERVVVKKRFLGATIFTGPVLPLGKPRPSLRAIENDKLCQVKKSRVCPLDFLNI